jgi:hypothetical protein
VIESLRPGPLVWFEASGSEFESDPGVSKCGLLPSERFDPNAAELGSFRESTSAFEGREVKTLLLGPFALFTMSAVGRRSYRANQLMGIRSRGSGCIGRTTLGPWILLGPIEQVLPRESREITSSPSDCFIPWPGNNDSAFRYRLMTVLPSSEASWISCSKVIESRDNDNCSDKL